MCLGERGSWAHRQAPMMCHRPSPRGGKVHECLTPTPVRDHIAVIIADIKSENNRIERKMPDRVMWGHWLIR